MTRKPPFVVRLDRKIRHHRELAHKYWNNPEKRNYHERWRAACEKELAEWLEDHKGGVVGSAGHD